ncbi:hypothetical protein [Streptomyces canus]|uniref:hypothetical protein n=1 Tax=Streptomyces canus TaxID=58343 RepID=UPI002DD9CFB4|nr:hypothetical protein [Streptomyces canus]
MAALLESKTLRDGVLERTDALDRVKALSVQVGLTAIRSLVLDHRTELETNGYRVLTGSELSSFKELSGIQ